MRALFTGGKVDTGFNGDFGEGSSGLPDAWRISDPVSGDVLWDPAVGHTRPGSVVVRHPGSDSTAAELAVTPVVQPTVSGEAFALAAWAQAVGVRAAGTVAIEWLDQGGLVVDTAVSAPLPADPTGWQLLTVRSRAPERAAFARVCLRTSGDGGAVLYDDVVFGPAGVGR